MTTFSTATDAPGLAWRARKGGEIPMWIAPAEAVKQGFTPRTVRLGERPYATRPDGLELAELSATCRRLHGQAREWLILSRKTPARFDGTLRSLVQLYQTHEASRFHKISPETRRSYVYALGIIAKAWGPRRLSGIKAVEILNWHAIMQRPRRKGGEPRTRLAHAVMTMLRQVFGFGIVLDITEAKRLAIAMHEMRFETTPPRESAITPAQVAAHRAKAHELGFPSIALADAIMFECVLRQKDVIGEWLKDPTADPNAALTSLGQVWRTGLVWGEHVSRDLILSKPTSKSGGRKKAEHDLRLCPMAMEELQHTPTERRIGPVIVSEATGIPWRARHFRETWRMIARACGIPDEVWSMDARAGGITEGSDAGADIEHLRKTATHSSVSTTGRYNRDGLSKSRKVAEVRALHRRRGE